MNTKLKGALDRALVICGAALVAVTFVVLVTAGNDSVTTVASGKSAPVVDKVAIEDFKFLPAEISVPVGTKITWTNSDAAPHTATSGKGSSADGVFNTKTIEKDGSASITLKKAGTFAYYCKFHSFMKGTVTVK